MSFHFFRKRNCWRPTIWGWLLILVILALLFRLWMITVSSYLSVNDPIKAKTLVVEGWIEDGALAHAVKFYKENHYQHLIVTGIPVTYREDFLLFHNTAEAAAALLKRDGFTDTIYQAAIPSTIFIDRTFNTAVATRMIFEKHPDWKKSFNIYSVGVHARRTHLMFERAFGDQYKIGMISEKDPTFDPEHWWRTSKGFRNVSNEFAAYVFVWAFFHPDYEVYRNKMIEGFHSDQLKRQRQKKKKNNNADPISHKD